MSRNYMLHDDSLLNEIAQTTMSDPFATDIMARINDHPKKCKAWILVTLQLRMGYSIIITSFMYQLEHVAPEYYKITTMILFPATLGSRKHWSCYLWSFGGPNLGNLSKKLSRHVTSLSAPKQLNVVHTAFSIHFQFLVDLGPLSP